MHPFFGLYEHFICYELPDVNHDSYNYALRITHCIKPQQAGERLPCLINIHIAVTRKLLIVSLLVELSLNLDRETEEVDKACGISLIVNLISVECSNFLIVECVR